MLEFNYKITIIFLAVTIILIFPPETIYSLERAAELYNQGEYQEAISYLDQLDLKEYEELEKWEKYRHLAFLYKEIGNIDKYAEFLRKSYDSSSENNKIKLEMAIAYYQAGFYEKASVIFDELVFDIEDNDDLLISDLMRLYFYQGKNAFALEKFNKARYSWEKGLSLEEHAQFYIELGNLNFELNKHEKAFDYYKLALETDSSLSYLYPKIAKTAEKSGELQKALNLWQRSLETGIHKDKAQENLDRLEELISEPEEVLEPEEKVLPEIESEVTWKPEWKEVLELEGYNDSPRIKVKTGTSRNELQFKFDSAFIISTEEGNVISRGEPYETWRITIRGNKFELRSNSEEDFTISIPAETELILQSSNNSSSFMLQNVKYGMDYFWAGREDRQYRGDLIIRPREERSEFITMNRVYLEEYLLSVVPSEMPSGWPVQALKTQALAARSFAYYNLGRRHLNDPYDFCDTVHCAVYSGINSETEITNQAVIETMGEVGLYNDEVIEAVFSSNSGGHIEAASEVWGGGAAYLKGTDLQLESNYNFPLLPGEMQDWITERVNTYSGPGTYSYNPAYRWVRRLDANFLQENFELNNIKDIVVKERTENGFVKSIKIKGTENTIELNGDNIRSALGGLRSNKFIIHKKYSPEGKIKNVSFYGAGWGHGVGMDQTAAAHMAEEGKNYSDIFKQFYQGIKIEKIY